MGFTIFGLTFNLYGLVLGIAILCAYEASKRYGQRIGFKEETLSGLFWWAIVGGIVGARLYHVIDKWKEIYSLNPQSVFYVWNGGLGIWGAVIGGVTSLWLGTRVMKTKINRRLLDVAFFGLPLGQAIGRWGNFFNNEIVGKNGEPLFLYENLLNLFLFSVLWRVSKSKVRPGRIAGVYLVGYGLIRIFLEQLRPDEIVWKLMGFPVASLMSLLAIVIGLYLAKASLATSSMFSTK